jgi:putative FmdB family regulatory protein
MPLYEYYCSHCHNKFDALRPIGQADVPIKCTHCESQRTARVLSLFFAVGGGSSASSDAAESSGGGGCGCGGHCACGHSHN